MVNVSFDLDENTRDDLDRIIAQKKASGDIPMNTSRSEVLRQLVEEYVEGNGKSLTAGTATATAD